MDIENMLDELETKKDGQKKPAPKAKPKRRDRQSDEPGQDDDLDIDSVWR